MNLSTEQAQAFEAFKAGQNIMITGPGGTGKSHLIKVIIDECEAAKKRVQACAMTGCAAVLLQCKAKTIHSWAGLGLGTGVNRDVVFRVLHNKKTKMHWEAIDVLIIDEVSMLSKKLFDILDAIGRHIKGKLTIPFGGIQLVLSGDFYQLPPISNATPLGIYPDVDSGAFCFESDAWSKAIPSVICLKTIYRQEDDAFKKLLNLIRVGRITQQGINLLQTRVGVVNTGDIKATILFPRRNQVEQMNQLEFDKLVSDEIYTYELVKTNSSDGLSPNDLIKRNRFPEYARETELTYLETSTRASTPLVLKIGTLVMCITNLDLHSSPQIVNGSQGIIIRFANKFPVVRFYNGRIMTIMPYEWSSEFIPGVSVMQIPLTYAWAMTIHKSQGVTLDIVEVDAGNKIFACGQTYVALSRVRSLEGLFLTSFDHTKILVNKKVKDFYGALISV